MSDPTRQFYVYILTNRSGTLYIGMTNDLTRRLEEHRLGLVPGFTSKYHVHRLIHYETYPTAMQAIEREKQLKGWRRERKLELIRSVNPDMVELGLDE